MCNNVPSMAPCSDVNWNLNGKLFYFEICYVMHQMLSRLQKISEGTISRCSTIVLLHFVDFLNLTRYLDSVQSTMSRFSLLIRDPVQFQARLLMQPESMSQRIVTKDGRKSFCVMFSFHFCQVFQCTLFPVLRELHFQ